jgi:NADH dehydrogenase FAD-containing subunit
MNRKTICIVGAGVGAHALAERLKDKVEVILIEQAKKQDIPKQDELKITLEPYPELTYPEVITKKSNSKFYDHYYKKKRG